jgi:hypothetical protein
MWEKGGRRVNMVQKSIHTYVNAKMITIKGTLGIRGKRMKENDRGGEFMYDIFDIL